MQSAKDATKDTTEQTKNYGVVKAGHGQEGHTTKDKASEGKHNTVSALNQVLSDRILPPIFFLSDLFLRLLFPRGLIMCSWMLLLQAGGKADVGAKETATGKN